MTDTSIPCFGCTAGQAIAVRRVMSLPEPERWPASSHWTNSQRAYAFRIYRSRQMEESDIDRQIADMRRSR